MFVYHFVDPGVRVETFFEKDEAAENDGRWFWNRGYSKLCTLLFKAEENFMQSLSAFLLLFDDKKICPILSSLYYWVHSRGKTYTLRLLLTCLEALEEGFFCFPGRDQEGVIRSLFSLVNLYQTIWIWNLDQNLIMAFLLAAFCSVLF